MRVALYPVVKDTQPLAIALPAADNRSAGRGQSHCQPRAIEVPAAGTSSASRGESCSQPLGIVFPALGNRVPSPWELCSQPLGIVFPALGNRVPSTWESCSQPLGIVFPAAGNSIPNRRGNFIIAVRQTVSMCCAVSCLHRKICTIALNLLRQAQIAAPAWSVGQCGGGDMW